MAHALIVDDDPDVVDWLQEVARMEGFTVARAHSIREARIELILLRWTVRLSRGARVKGQTLDLPVEPLMPYQQSI